VVLLASHVHEDMTPQICQNNAFYFKLINQQLLRSSSNIATSRWQWNLQQAHLMHHCREEYIDGGRLNQRQRKKWRQKKKPPAQNSIYFLLYTPLSNGGDVVEGYILNNIYIYENTQFFMIKLDNNKKKHTKRQHCLG